MDDQLKELIRQSPPTWALASRLKDAYGIPRDEWEQVLKFEWEDTGDKITVRCNGSGETKLWTGTPYGDSFPDPSAVPVPAGAHLVCLDGKALLKTTPDGQEWFCERDRTRHFEEYVIRVIHARLKAKGEDMPDVEQLLQPKA